MKAQFAALGLTGTRLSAVNATDLDSRHVLAKVQWEMTVRSSNGVFRNFDAFATYVLRRDDQDRMSIIFQLDHQNLTAVINHELSAR
ncbi:MAG: hypothetical protein ACRD3B_20350 [Candidatus Sulfotelmatobacter sp.]